MRFFPACRQAGAEALKMIERRRNGRRKISKKFSAALLFQVLD